MKSLTTILILTLLSTVGVKGQSKTQQYKDCEVCSTWRVHKGKKQHGQKYCVGYATIRKYQTGKTDTVGWSFGGDTWIDNTYDRYIKLSARDKFIVDSLKEDGIPQFQQSYLMYEPIYMKTGRKIESFWDIGTGNVTVLKYLIFNNKNGHGISLISEQKLN